MKLELRLADLPDYEEFQNLFTQFKISHGWTTTTTPTFKGNMAGSFGLGGANAVRNPMPMAKNMGFF